MKLLVINGPNLNFLGIREKGIYGTQDYKYLVDMIQGKAKETGCEIECFQSNHEGVIIDRIQEAYFDGPAHTRITRMRFVTRLPALRFQRWKSISRTSRSGKSSGAFPSQRKCVTTRYMGMVWTVI